jgi:hypothetical protein
LFEDFDIVSDNFSFDFDMLMLLDFISAIVQFFLSQRKE